ncbi:hypothetical protein [Sphingobacterium sp. FBM7-1]|uniref:hypothetical protein n=1 Tax=Sphingobacterium sp. FBM7-1 TaxID=2886688 RepID=UPI001D108062|nr:hypothetical protein [Sphingobacterium sp. FBM7-1]MCC2599680.1 hypothetical protein [Sphingobacterium sp. FBM7-1]
MIQSAAQNHLGTGATDYVTNTYNSPVKCSNSSGQENLTLPKGNRQAFPDFFAFVDSNIL